MPEPDWSMAPTRPSATAWRGSLPRTSTRPSCGSDETEQRRDGGRLAGPVRSEEREHLTLGHLQVQPVEGNPGPVAVGDAPEGQGDWARPAREPIASGGAATREDKTFSDGSGRARAV